MEGQAGEHATVLALIRHDAHQPQVSILVDHPETPQVTRVICVMEQSAVCDGLVVYSTVIDALFGRRDAAWRNGILQRLHRFDGGIATGKLRQTMARGARFSVRINRPTLGLMAYGVSRRR